MAPRGFQEVIFRKGDEDFTNVHSKITFKVDDYR
jgi:hypothetical protein